MVYPKKQLSQLSTRLGSIFGAAAVCLISAGHSFGDEPVKPSSELREPVYRVTKQETRVPDTTTALVAPVKSTKAVRTTASQVQPERTSQTQLTSQTVEQPGAVVPAVQQPETHPLDEPIAMAQQSLDLCHAKIADYTSILVKRQRVGGRLQAEEYMFSKVRNEKLGADGQPTTPFSVYLKFLKPGSIKGREVIYVKGANNGKMIAHEGGFKGKFTPSLYLDPNGALAMMGQRYPITEVGIERLCEKLIERASRDRGIGMCTVTKQPAVINKRPATRVELLHPEKKPGLDFHIARVFVDDEYGVPVRYEAYDWPLTPDAPVGLNELIEEFTYVRLKFNVGLTDADFDPKNPDYNMK